jgi:pyruvate dehydrogenase E1 component beta subunit
MGRDANVVALGQDIGLNGGVFRVTDGLYEKYGEDRVIDTPLAESGIMGTSIGMAIAGLRPVAEIQFSGFAYLILGQLEGHAARLRMRTHGKFTVPLVVRMPYGGGVRALEHHSESKEATYAHIPGVKVVIPSTPSNARGLLISAIRDPDPVVFMEPKRSYRAFREEVSEEQIAIEIGKAQVVQEGSDVTVISWGAMMRSTQQAIEELAPRRGMSVELIDLLTISPLDTDTITASVKKTGRCVIVQEAHRSFGPASEIIATINDKALMHLEAPVRRVTGYDVAMPNFGRENAYMPSKCQICKAVEETVDF